MDEASDDEFGGWPAGEPDSASTYSSRATAETMLAAESNARRLEHETAGMREGYEIGKEETVQEGFDQGFRLASSVGFVWGKAMGAATMLDVTAGFTQQEVKKKACDALWQEHGEMKERFPERRVEERLPEEALAKLEKLVSERMAR